MGSQPAAEGYLEVPGGRVWYRIAGADQPGTPLLCLHGGPGMPHDYLEPLEDLAASRPVVFYDQLGCGRSDRPADDSLWTTGRFVEELTVVRAALGLERPHLFGNSWGGWLALQYTLDRRPQLASLILSSCPPSVPRWITDCAQLRAELDEPVRDVLDRHEAAGYFSCPEYQWAVTQFYRRHLCRQDPWPDCVERTFAGLGGDVYVTMWGPSEFGPVTGHLRDWDVTNRLPEIQAPTLVTGGRHDEARPAHLAVLADRIPGAELVIFENSSHMAFIEERQRYIQVVEDFLTRTDLALAHVQSSYPGPGSGAEGSRVPVGPRGSPERLHAPPRLTRDNFAARRAVTRLAGPRSGGDATAINQGGDGPSLARLIERSAELKRALVEFALSSRMERHLERFMSESAGRHEVLTGDEAIDAIDRFALQYRLPNGKTVLDQFLAGWPDLSAADREMLRGWRDPVDGIFEVCGRDRDSLTLLNLIDDLEYRTYSNMGPAAFRPLPKHGFVYARLVPIGRVPDAWLVSGSMRAYRKSDAAQVAQAALKLATRLPELVYRNPAKLERAWQQMRAERAAFVEFFGGDELVLPPAEAGERINAFYRHRQDAALAARPARRRPPNIAGVDVPSFDLPPELAGAETIGLIYDEIDGLNFYNDYGMLRDLFADPALASDRRYADALHGYLRAETIGPLPFRRLAAAHPQTVDAVFRKILRQKHFTWSEHGEALLRRRKPWYYEHEPRPNRTIIGARLGELVSR